MESNKKIRYSRFGKALKKIRTDAGMSQQDLAAKIGTKQSMISAYESSKAEPNITTIVAIADVFKISTDKLFGRKERTAEDPETSKRKSK